MSLSNLKKVSKTLVYYSHPYTSCDKGSIERHNGLIRRFIPKGECIENYSLQEAVDIEIWMNTLPRKQLASDEIFEKELDNIPEYPIQQAKHYQEFWNKIKAKKNQLA